MKSRTVPAPGRSEYLPPPALARAPRIRGRADLRHDRRVAAARSSQAMSTRCCATTCAAARARTFMADAKLARGQAAEHLLPHV